jgi:hypothetical protein
VGAGAGMGAEGGMGTAAGVEGADGAAGLEAALGPEAAADPGRVAGPACANTDGRVEASGACWVGTVRSGTAAVALALATIDSTCSTRSKRSRGPPVRPGSRASPRAN